MEAWGFRYKTLAFLWLKQNRKADSWFYGMGFWTRSNAEVCLLATRGHPKRQCAGIHQFVISHIEQHSKKPDEVREKIVKLMGDFTKEAAIAAMIHMFEKKGKSRFNEANEKAFNAGYDAVETLALDSCVR